MQLQLSQMQLLLCISLLTLKLYNLLPLSVVHSNQCCNGASGGGPGGGGRLSRRLRRKLNPRSARSQGTSYRVEGSRHYLCREGLLAKTLPRKIVLAKHDGRHYHERACVLCVQRRA
jgi:hypothetical protein